MTTTPAKRATWSPIITQFKRLAKPIGATERTKTATHDGLVIQQLVIEREDGFWMLVVAPREHPKGSWRHTMYCTPRHGTPPETVTVSAAERTLRGAER